MCMQPPFFSIDARHWGQRLVLARSQLTFSDSSEAFCVQRSTSLHEAGMWSPMEAEWQVKQKRKPHLHTTASLRLLRSHFTELVQPGEGHHLTCGLSSMNERTRYLEYCAASSGDTMRRIATS